MNEFQVAYDKAKRESYFKDESTKGYALLKDHPIVVMQWVTRYCPYTDAIMGSDILVYGAYDTEEDAQKVIDGYPASDEIGFYFLRRQTPEELKSYNLVDDKDIPF